MPASGFYKNGIKLFTPLCKRQLVTFGELLTFRYPGHRALSGRSSWSGPFLLEWSI